MAHQMAYLNPLLTIGSEFRPVFGNRRIEVQLPAIGDEQCSEGRHGFCRRIDIEDGVLFPRTGFASSAKPPQRSTTVLPSAVAQHEAPASAPLAKFASNLS